MNFQEAVEKVKTLKAPPSDDILLKLYGLYKQVTEGDCTRAEPGMFEFKEKRKYTAWMERKGLSKEEAEKKYINVVSQLLSQE